MRMVTSPTDRWRHASQAGFTLIELLAVMTILAIAITAFSYSGGKGLGTARFRAMLVETSAAISAERSAAIRQAEERVFRIDVRNRRLGGATGREISMPDGVMLTASIAQSEQNRDGTAGIRFYPAGTSSGGTLAFTYQGQVYEIRVNWLTGSVTMHRV
jgi:general secretion pathway protein H